jgi:hypothetical protein
MKLFSCTNEDCKSHVPYDAKTNRIIARLTSDHPMLEDGTINPDSEAEVVKLRYICGRCGSPVKEVPLSKVMKVEIKKVDKRFAYGKFYNKLRKRPYDFNIEKSSGELSVRGLNPLKVESDFIREEYKQSYINSISAEVIDYEEDKYNRKTFEVNIFNPSQNDTITLFILEDELVDYYGREPMDIEISKAKHKVKEVPY